METLRGIVGLPSTVLSASRCAGLEEEEDMSGDEGGEEHCWAPASTGAETFRDEPLAAVCCASSFNASLVAAFLIASSSGLFAARLAGLGALTRSTGSELRVGTVC